MDLLHALIALGFIALGAVLQRVAGMGVGMIAAPTLSLLVGPIAGVTLSNVAASVAALILFLMLRRHVDWPRFLRLAPLLIAGSFLGAWAVASLDHGWLEILLGTCILIAIAAALGLQKRFTLTGNSAVYGSGAVAGFMNTTAGVAGPALAVYAVAAKWEQRSWAATLQPIFLLANLTSIGTKALFGAAVPGDVHVPWPVWVAVLLGAPLGILIGSRVARRVDPAKARVLALCIASAGGMLAVVRGVGELVG
ncbi:sulfite exporter TauE/SafE family protein [Micrococcus sp. FDAARGOS_333]|uniref:sulfite exporter TauE/SafE family protein n=1 Tax=Micrococcus sp. FDAARGOS_333 TaxID=1930558 RepID=UPI000B4E481A|nr:sulfite exporter TauE/SafE family protein [Micrococcus sp. FDAARGOS_333]PNL16929.1 sulfite exporter TauE/SafE family protein [Micrococcus sp. FDAARGOS_333]